MAGPTTRDVSSLAIGLAQVRVGPSATNISSNTAVLESTDSIGSLTETAFVGNTEWWEHEAGFPLVTDYQIPIREAAALECAYEEMTPYNLALSYGKDPTDGSYDSAHSGEIALGGRTAPEFVRMEAVYTFPNGTNTMTIIFPRAQVRNEARVEFSKTEGAANPITFSASRADSASASGDAAWDGKPLGVIRFA
jgi:hypothetical protein